jgi:hypothetical protein
MPTGPSSISYIIPPLTLSDTFYEWYNLTNTDIIDKLNRVKVYELDGDTGIAVSVDDSGIGTIYIDTVIPGDHTFTGNITFNGAVTTVNTNLITIDDYNLVLGAVGSDGGTGGTSDAIITNAGGGGIVIAGACGDKYFLWKAFDGGKTYTAWRISDSLAFAGDAKLYSGNNKFILSEGDDNTPASRVTITTHSGGVTVDTETYFDSVGTTYGNFAFLSDGSTRVINGSLLKRFTMPVGGITGIGLTFGMVVRHDTTTNGVTLALANTPANAESFGVAVNLNTTSNFVDVNLLGYVSGNFADCIASQDSMTSLGTGEFYFLSDTEAGKITKTPPYITGRVRKPILYALGSTAAMVMNYVGAKNVDYDALYSKLNASTIVISHDPNEFSIGDVVRFEEGITSGTRLYGSYVKAQCTSPEEAEAIGIISKVNYGGSSASSLITISGFIDLSATGLTYSPGQVYFLGEEPGELTLESPSTVNTVRKPMMVAVSPTTAVVQNYVGLVIDSNSSTGTSIGLSSSSGQRNKLINGNFDIWQRGTTFSYRNPSAEQDRYSADRWKLVNTGGSTADRLGISVNRIPLGLGDLPNSTAYSNYGLQFAIGTGGYTAGSSTYLYQRIEGIENLPKGYATVSFYARSTVTNSRLGVSFRRDFGGGTAPDYATSGVEQNSQKVSGFVTVVPTEWTKFTHTFSLPDCSNGLIGASGTDGPEIRFFIRAGSDLVTSKDVSEAINPNLINANSYNIEIAQVQLESGREATEFDLRDQTSEMQKCMRYYQTNAMGTTYERRFSSLPNPLTSIGSPLFADELYFGVGENIKIQFPVRMRIPTYSTSFRLGLDSSSNPLAISEVRKSANGFLALRGTGISSQTAFYYEAEAEL